MSKQFRAPYDRIRGKLDPNPIHSGSAVTVTQKQSQSATSVTNLQNLIIPCNPGLLFRDRVTPGYKQMSAKGKVIVSPNYREFQDYVLEPFSGVTYHSEAKYATTPSAGAFLSDVSTWYDWLAFGPGYVFPTNPVISTDFIVNQASNEAIAASHQRDVLGIVDLMEMGKTVDLIRNNFSRLEKLVTGKPLKKLGKRKYSKSSSTVVMRYKGRTPMGVLSDLAGLHLEYHYGILPLMMSIEGLMNVLDDQSKPKRQTYRGSASVSDDISNSLVVPEYGVFNTTAQVGTTTYTTKFQYDYYTRAGLLTEFRPTVLGSLGMEMRDIPTAVYELIPFSFVVDWVYDINTAIEAATPVKGWSALGSWLTLVKEEYLQYIYTRSGWSDSKSFSSPSKYTHTVTVMPLTTTVSFVRRTKTRTPGLTARMPKLDLQFRSYTHALSALALTISIGKKKVGMRI